MIFFLVVVIGLFAAEIAFVIWYPRRPPVIGPHSARFRVGYVRGPVVWSWGTATLQVNRYAIVLSPVLARTVSLAPSEVGSVRITRPWALTRVAFMTSDGESAAATVTMHRRLVDQLQEECERLGWHLSGWDQPRMAPRLGGDTGGVTGSPS